MKASTLLRAFALVISALVTLVLLIVLLIALYGWNWMRAPLERYALEKTGRVLQIEGDLTLKFGWPVARLRADGVEFANPTWAQQKTMLAAQGVEVAVDVSQLLARKIAFPEVLLDHAAVFLEQASDGRRSWLLDLEQKDEEARIWLGRIALDHGTLGYDDTAEKTSIRGALSTANVTTGTRGSDLAFTAQGKFRGVAMNAKGTGGPVLALRDTVTPYPLKLEALLGRTQVKADGTVTGLLALTAVDMRMDLKGDSLEQLYPLLGIAFPATRAYSAEGRLRHFDDTWRFERFSGRVGTSDIAGFVQVVTGGARPKLTADLRSELLALDDLGPVIGARPDSAAKPPGPARVLPEMPFHTERWGSVNADVKLRAKTIARPKALPLENLNVELKMRDEVISLEPLAFGFAGGQLSAFITLDGRNKPIRALAKVRARKLLLSKLFPTVELTKTSLGELNGEFDLSGSGNSVGSMLASSNGKLTLVVSDGQISRLLMEKAGLHIWEIVTLTLTGDKQVKLRCVVADFDVKQGIMQTDALVFDTEVTTLIGSGNIDLQKEQFNLLLNQRTKNTSPVALRSPIYVRGSFAKPNVGVDKGKVAIRAAGALALGIINPFLALIPLVDAGPGEDSDCGQLVRDAKTLPK
ncbi:MAG: AsmA family protein [Rhodoferax sp.]|nr:AsmA family protein [Rhodoferax sp.]